MLNLIDAHFQNSNLFGCLPVFDGIYYEGLTDGKVQQYRAVREDQACTLLALTLIRKDEDVLWASTQDFLERSVRSAAAGVHGKYTFDLLAFDLHGERAAFDDREMAAVIVQHSRKLSPGGQRLVKYCSAYGLLRKLVHEEWGNMVLKTAVEVFKGKASHLDIPVRRLLRQARFAHGPFIAMINDVSSQPLYDPGDAAQQKLLKDAVEKSSRECIEFLPEVYLQDKNGVRELLSGTEIAREDTAVSRPWSPGP